MIERAHVQGFGERLSEIRERASRAKVGAGPHMRSRDDERHVLARMIRARGRRIVAVVGRHQQQIAGAIDLIVYSELFLDGVRRITNITDLRFDKDTGKISLEDICTFEQQRIDEKGGVVGDWVMSKKKPSSYAKFVKRNVPLAGFEV